jgi:hypothetical protein
VLVEGDLTYAPTCTTDGNNYYKCTRCSSAKNEKITRLGHTADETNYTISSEPDCTQTGLASSVCTVCGTEFEITLEALGHNYENVVTEIADQPGHSLSTPTCTRCGLTTTDVEKVHDEWVEGCYTSKTTSIGSNACTSIQTVTDSCNYCSQTRTSTVQPAGHDYHFSNMNDNNSFVYTCSKCGESTTRTSSMLQLLWNSSYINTSPDDTDNGYLFEVTGDGIINAKDYGAIVRAGAKSE